MLVSRPQMRLLVCVASPGVVFIFSHVNAAEHGRGLCHFAVPHRVEIRNGRRSSVNVRHLRDEETYEQPCPHQRSVDATKNSATPPRIMNATGGRSHTGPGGRGSVSRATKKVTGASEDAVEVDAPRRSQRWEQAGNRAQRVRGAACCLSPDPVCRAGERGLMCTAAYLRRRR